jgi:hypothetical protein
MKLRQHIDGGRARANPCVGLAGPVLAVLYFVILPFVL